MRSFHEPKQVERDITYKVVIYNNALYRQAVQVVGTFITVEEAYRTPLNSLDDIDEDGTECGGFEHKTHGYGTLSLSTAGEVNWSFGFYNTQMITHERKLSEPAPSIV